SAELSTSWYLPSSSVYLKSTVGNPASTPVSACTLMPFSTAGMYSFGTAPPILLDVVRKGRKIPAVALPTKAGVLFIWDRVTGKPIYDVEERPVVSDNTVP